MSKKDSQSSTTTKTSSLSACHLIVTDLKKFATKKEMNERFDKVDEKFDKVDEKFDKVDERFDKVDERFDKVDERFDKVENQMSEMSKNIADDVIKRIIPTLDIYFEKFEDKLSKRAKHDAEMYVNNNCENFYSKIDDHDNEIKIAGNQISRNYEKIEVHNKRIQKLEAV